MRKDFLTPLILVFDEMKGHDHDAFPTCSMSRDAASTPHEGPQPTPEFYDKYVAYWMASNSSEDAKEFNSPPMNIVSFDDFVSHWQKMPPNMQHDMARMYEDGYDITHQKDMQLAESALREFEENPEERERVQAEVEAALAK